MVKTAEKIRKKRSGGSAISGICQPQCEIQLSFLKGQSLLRGPMCLQFSKVSKLY